MMGVTIAGPISDRNRDAVLRSAEIEVHMVRIRPRSLLLLALAACPRPTPPPDAGPAPVVDSGPADPCTPAQCQAIHKASGGYCGAAAPYGCTLTGGCYSTEAAAQGGCPGNWCSTLACSAIPQPQRSSRRVIVQNNCPERLSIYLTDPSPASNPHPYCGGAADCLLFAVDAGASQTFNATLVLNDAGGYYWMPAGGVAFWAMPDDGDTADTTLFEINFGAFGGTADSYDLSAIPPGSCSGHVQAPSNDLGYADHLPAKDAGNPAQSWACLRSVDGGPNPATCGDGLGHWLCPAIVSDAGYGTIKPLTAVEGKNTGCGVPGETCVLADGGSTTDGGCCPDICAVAQDQSAMSPAVRSLIYECAHGQGLLTGTGRRTGFWKSLRVDPVGDAGCERLVCMVPDGGPIPDGGGPFSAIGYSCQAYLWPYDDAEAGAVCEATPDYKVTFCP